jgi:hypothetical protein
MPETTLTKLSASQLQRAASLKQRIESLEKDLAQLLGAATNTTAAAAPRRRRRRMSAAARARISAAAKARWARVKAKKA